MASRTQIAVSILALLLLPGCRGHEPKGSLAPEQIQLADLALQLVVQSEAMMEEVPESLAPSFQEYLESARRFSNESQRYGAGSLRGRDAFDRMRYQASQLDTKITTQDYPDVFEKWQALRKNYIDKIGATLGYRIEESGSTTKSQGFEAAKPRG